MFLQYPDNSTEKALLDDYQGKAMRTAPAFRARTLNPIQDYLVHAVLGLTTEIAEIIEDRSNLANVRQEIGDVAWYLSLGCAALGTRMGEVADVLKHYEFHTKGLSLYAYMISRLGFLADQVKRNVYYSTLTKEVETDKRKCIMAITDILICLSQLSEGRFFKYLDANIDKLAIRYPDKFESNKAIERNVSKEEELFKI